jgi:glutamate-5-semialdehyde dehydrogenase
MSSLQASLQQIKLARQRIRRASAQQKNQVLEILKQKLIQDQTNLLHENEKDLKIYQQGADFQKAFYDRLKLTPSRIQGMIESLTQVISQPDPVGQVVAQSELQPGLIASQVRDSLGVIFIIFESRPNVVTEAFSLAMKAGNAVILRGGKESFYSCQALYRMIAESLDQAGVGREVFWGLEDQSRQWVETLLQSKESIDVVIPRGGDSLIHFVRTHSSIPMIINDRGLCHIYVDASAELEMAKNILLNAKVQRPGVCNAAETLLIHKDVAAKYLPVLYQHLSSSEVQWFACPESFETLKGKKDVFPATEKSFDTEYLDLKISVRVVQSLEQAMQHIGQHGSKHSEAIVTEDAANADRFLKEVDAAAVYWNASTRFTDGYQLGLGGEVGISTQKLHVRGPVGLQAMTSPRWILRGHGHIRG